MTGSITCMTPTLLEHQQQRLAPLLQIADSQQRLACLVEEARRRPALPLALRVEAHRVEGCLVRVWFVPEFRDGRCHFHCDSDAVSLKAVGGLLCELYSGHSSDEIAASTSGVLEQLTILHQLAENRQRTIARIEEQIRNFAREHQTKG